MDEEADSLLLTDTVDSNIAIKPSSTSENVTPTKRARGRPRKTPRPDSNISLKAAGRGRRGKEQEKKEGDKLIQTRLSFKKARTEPDDESQKVAANEKEQAEKEKENEKEKETENGMAPQNIVESPRKRVTSAKRKRKGEEDKGQEAEQSQKDEEAPTPKKRGKRGITTTNTVTPKRRATPRKATEQTKKKDSDKGDDHIPPSPEKKKQRRKKRNSDDEDYQAPEGGEEESEEDIPSEEDVEVKEDLDDYEEETPKTRTPSKKRKRGSYIPKSPGNRSSKPSRSKWIVRPEEHKAQYKRKRDAAMQNIQDGIAFPHWLPPMPLPIESEYEAYVGGLPTMSIPFITKKDAEMPRMIPLFSCIAIEAEEEEQRLGDATLILNVGGPVWSLDWCPLTPRPPNDSGSETPPTREYLAVGCHPSLSATHVQGKAVYGPALIQIWDLGPLSDDSQSPYSKEARPKMVLGILHDGGCVWDLKWCPTQGNTPVPPLSTTTGERGHYPRLGLLAASLGDGSAVILSIPNPAFLESNGSPLFVHASDLQMLTLRLPDTNIVRLQWCPQPPHSLLLTGCDDGQAAVWEFGQNTVEPPAAPVYICNANKRKLNSIQWHPTHQSVFCAAGQASVIKFWDIRNPFLPMYTHLTAAGWVMDMVWGGEEYPYLIFSADDYSIRSFCPNTLMLKIFRYHTMVPWSLAISPWVGHLASASADGTVGILRVDPKIMLSSKSGNRPKEEIAQWSSSGKVGDTEVLRMLPSDEERVINTPQKPKPPPKPKKGAAKGKGKEQAQKGSTASKPPPQQAPARRLPPLEVAFHRVCWSANPSSAGWLATGGATGFVRLSHLSNTI